MAFTINITGLCEAATCCTNQLSSCCCNCGAPTQCPGECPLCCDYYGLTLTFDSPWDFVTYNNQILTKETLIVDFGNPCGWDGPLNSGDGPDRIIIQGVGAVGLPFYQDITNPDTPCMMVSAYLTCGVSNLADVPSNGWYLSIRAYYTADLIYSQGFALVCDWVFRQPLMTMNSLCPPFGDFELFYNQSYPNTGPCLPSVVDLGGGNFATMPAPNITRATIEKDCQQPPPQQGAFQRASFSSAFQGGGGLGFAFGTGIEIPRFKIPQFEPKIPQFEPKKVKVKVQKYKVVPKALQKKIF